MNEELIADIRRVLDGDYFGSGAEYIAGVDAILERALTALQATCAWEYLGDKLENDGHWESECGSAWSFIDGGPEENEVKFCQGCGKRVSVPPPPKSE